ncbi:MAG TPA: hypothetical protein VFV05_19875 [Methylomirabilota bacterium]|nr:hypothetical protein [Methylomirabilota bacterium]
MPRYRFAAFWATVLVVMGMLLALGGVLFAAAAVALDMPWGGLTGQAVLERALAAAVLVISGILAGAPFIVLGEMMRLLIEQRRTIGRQRRLLARMARRLDEATGHGQSGSPVADRLLQQRRP